MCSSDLASDRRAGPPTGQDIYLLTVATSVITRLTAVSQADGAPYWYDANRIAFQSTLVGGGGLAFVSPTESPPLSGAAPRIANTLKGDAAPG